MVQMVHIGLNAHLLSRQAGYRRAGIHTYIAHTLRELPALAPDYKFTALLGAGVIPPESMSARQSRLDTSSPLRRIWWEQALQPMQLGEFDLVHEMAFVAPLIMPKPFVVTVYDLTFMRYPERLPASRRIYLRLLTRLSCHRARRVIAISRSTAQDLTTFLGVPAAKIDLAIPGVEAAFRPLPPDQVRTWREGKGLPPRFILCVCTLEPRKNLTTLIAAYAGLPRAEREQVHLVLAGGRGWMTEEIDVQIEQLGVSGTIHLPGFLANDELVWWYNAAELFAYPSVFEGWGMPITEALACGKPVIVSDVSSLPEATGDVGIRVPPLDVAAWQAALSQALSDPAWRAQTGEAARIRAARFTWTETAAQTLACYQKALAV